MAYTKEQRILNQSIGSTKSQRNTNTSIVMPSIVMPNNSGDHQKSIKRNTPVNDYDLVNKEYVDTALTTIPLDEIANPEGHTTFNMANKQIIFNFNNPTGTGNMELNASGAFSGDLLHVHQHTGNPGTVNLIHLEASDADVDGIRIATQTASDALVVESGKVTILSDNSSADTAYVPMVLYNTDATPPAANTTPVGTIYIQYTA